MQHSFTKRKRKNLIKKRNISKKNVKKYINLDKKQKKELKTHISYLIKKNKKYTNTNKNKYLFPK